MSIERFDSHEQKPWPAVSDHCGLSIDIEIRRNSSLNSQALERLKSSPVSKTSTASNGGDEETGISAIAESIDATRACSL
jgi:hypothetical protein